MQAPSPISSSPPVVPRAVLSGASSSHQPTPSTSGWKGEAAPPHPRATPHFITELHFRLKRCFASREPDPFGPIFAPFNALASKCTRSEKRFLARFLPRLHPFSSLFSDKQRNELITAKELHAKHPALAPYHALEKELRGALETAATPALEKQFMALHQHYQEQLGKLLTVGDRKAYLTPKAQLFYQGHFLIDRSLARELLSCDETGKVSRQNKQGSRPVTQAHGIHFKIGAEGFPKLDPAGEHAVSSLCHLLSPHKMVAAPTVILSIRMPQAKAYVQASLTVGGQSKRPSAIPLDELLSAIDSFHLLKDYYGSNSALKAKWPSLLKQARKSEPPAEPKTVLQEYVRWMKRHSSKNRPREFQDEHLPLKLGDFHEYLRSYPLPLWTKLLKLLKREPRLMKGRSIKSLLRLSPSLIWISKLFPNGSFEQIARELPILLDKVDQEALSRLFIASLVVNPHDGKADNYMVTIDWKAGSIDSLRIVAIDNDLAFEPPVLKAENTHHIRTKCLLYALPPKLLTSAIPTRVRINISSREPLDLLLEWITRLDQYQARSQLSFSLKLPESALANAFKKLNQIRFLLAHEITLEALFRRVEPVVFYSYREARQRGEGVSDAFALLDWKAGLPLEELLKEAFAKVEHDGEPMSLQEAYQKAAQSESSRTSLARATQAALNEASLFLEHRHYQQIAALSFVDQLKVKLRSPQGLLLSSIRAANSPLTRFALLNGADPNQCDEASHPPLYHLIPFPKGEKGEEIVQCLVGFGANLEWKDPKSGQTLLDLAASGAHLELFIALARSGAGRDCQATEVLSFAQAFIAESGMEAALKQLERQCHRIAWLQDLPAMLTHQPATDSFPLQRASLKNDSQVEVTETYLHPSVVEQIGITPNGQFPDKPKTQYGRHTIASIEHQGHHITFKDHPEMAGNEFLVSSLHQKIIGHGTPQSELFKARDTYGETYPVLASQTIEGTNFRDVFYGPDRAKKLALLDRHRLHSMILMAILTNPEDGKSEQYICSPLNDTHFQLTCVDNDHAFVRPFEGKKLMVKSVLFCLDQMQDRIDSRTRDLFLNLNPEEVLKSWLLECASQNKLYTALFDDPERQAQIKKNARDPIIIQMFLPERTTAKIFEKIGRIQEALKDENVKLIDLLLYAIPELGRYYQRLFTPYYKNPQQRWQEVKRKGGYVTDDSGGERTCTSTLDLLKHFGIDPEKLIKLNPAYFIDQGQADLTRLKAENAGIATITNELLQGETKNFKELLLDHNREKVLRGYPFGQKPSRDEKIFEAILSIKASFFQLNLASKVSYTMGSSWSQFTQVVTLSPFLRSLHLDRCKDVTEKFLWGLSTLCPHLKRLSLVESSSLKDVWASWGSPTLTFPNLRHLNLQRSYLRRFHIRAPRLMYLDLSRSTRLTRLTLDLPLLKRGKLDGCSKLSLKELKRVARELKSGLITATRCPPLKQLNHHHLIEQHLPLVLSPLDTFEERLLRAIKGLILNQAESLNLDWNEIGASGATALGRALEHNSSLSNLDLQSNNIGAPGATALARALEHNSSLSTLNLRYNNIGNSGATALARALEHNSSLSNLNLEWNNIGVSGARALARALEHNSSLSNLQLYDNNIRNSGATALARALEHNSSLSTLNLRYNNIGNSGATALSKGLDYNSSLTTLDLGRNYTRLFGMTRGAALESIERSLRRNKERAETQATQAASSSAPSSGSHAGGASEKRKEHIGEGSAE